MDEAAGENTALLDHSGSGAHFPGPGVFAHWREHQRLAAVDQRGHQHPALRNHENGPHHLSGLLHWKGSPAGQAV